MRVKDTERIRSGCARVCSSADWVCVQARQPVRARQRANDPALVVIVISKVKSLCSSLEGTFLKNLPIAHSHSPRPRSHSLLHILVPKETKSTPATPIATTATIAKTTITWGTSALLTLEQFDATPNTPQESPAPFVLGAHLVRTFPLAPLDYASTAPRCTCGAACRLSSEAKPTDVGVAVASKSTAQPLEADCFQTALSTGHLPRPDYWTQHLDPSVDCQITLKPQGKILASDD